MVVNDTARILEQLDDVFFLVSRSQMATARSFLVDLLDSTHRSFTEAVLTRQVTGLHYCVSVLQYSQPNQIQNEGAREWYGSIGHAYKKLADYYKLVRNEADAKSSYEVALETLLDACEGLEEIRTRVDAQSVLDLAEVATELCHFDLAYFLLEDYMMHPPRYQVLTSLGFGDQLRLLQEKYKFYEHQSEKKSRTS